MIEFLGRLHPAAVHFPVALIVMAAVAELAAVRKQAPWMASTALFMLSFGAVFAVISVVLGFMANSGREIVPELKVAIDLHRILGIATAVLGVLAAALAYGRCKDPFAASTGASEPPAAGPDESLRRRLYHVVLVLALLAVLAAGYFGAEVTHGRGHLLSH